MAESTTPIPLTISRAEQIFPTLSEAQMQRLASHGTPRSVRAGEVLVELGDKDIPIFLVMLGELEVVRPSFTQEILIRVIGMVELGGLIEDDSDQFRVVQAFQALFQGAGGGYALTDN